MHHIRQEQRLPLPRLPQRISQKREGKKLFSFSWRAKKRTERGGEVAAEEKGSRWVVGIEGKKLCGNSIHDDGRERRGIVGICGEMGCISAMQSRVLQFFVQNRKCEENNCE